MNRRNIFKALTGLFVGAPFAKATAAPKHPWAHWMDALKRAGLRREAVDWEPFFSFEEQVRNRRISDLRLWRFSAAVTLKNGAGFVDAPPFLAVGFVDAPPSLAAGMISLFDADPGFPKVMFISRVPGQGFAILTEGKVSGTFRTKWDVESPAAPRPTTFRPRSV